MMLLLSRLLYCIISDTTFRIRTISRYIATLIFIGSTLLLDVLVFSPHVTAQTVPTYTQESFSFSEPENLASQIKLTLWASHYYIHSFTANGTIAMRDSRGNSLEIYADTCDFCRSSLEGIAYTTDKNNVARVLRYTRRSDTSYVNCRQCDAYASSTIPMQDVGNTQWELSTNFGDGVLKYSLVPYRTIAVDKTVIPYGSVLYIPSVRGMSVELPNGVKIIHDGYFFAADKGGESSNRHIDIFSGIYSRNPFMGIVTGNESRTFTAYIIQSPSIRNSLESMHRR